MNARIPSPLELYVMMDRLPGVEYPCLVCGGRGGWIPDLGGCVRCGGGGEEPPGVSRDVAYPGGQAS